MNNVVLLNSNNSTKNFLKLVERLEKLQGLQEDLQQDLGLNFKQKSFSKTLYTWINKCVVIVFMSDLHIGSISTNYAILKEILEDILEYSAAYVVFNGDFIDNFFILANPAVRNLIESQIIGTDIQIAFMVQMIEQLLESGKVLLLNLGNHEKFSLPQIKACLAPLVRKYNLNVTLGSGQLTLKLQGIEDMDLLFSKGYLNSPLGVVWKFYFMHKSKPINLMLDLNLLKEPLLSFIPDVVVTSHYHKPSIHTIVAPTEKQLGQIDFKDVHFIQTGSLKDNPHNVSQFYFPAVVVTREKIHPFLNYKDAISFARLYELYS